ncbi:MAG: outer membrane beta-barrel protein [Ferruginibacter sp.]|nr:outer membrane beta-barrel protein [Ferruginibacter sp.]
MFKRISVSFIFLLFSQFLFAQQIEISGKIADTTSKSNVRNAIVMLLSAKDSVIKKYTRTDTEGKFSLDNITKGSYVLMVMHPLFADYVDNVDIDGANIMVGTIAVTPKSKLLEAVIIKSGSPIKIKGDTTIYTADSFKVSANANVEELLKKLPGIQVDKNGQIKAMGETVEKVLVDGEEFFGDDPGMAVKNLRADAVKEVQVFDKKSEQAEFTGIDDGNTQKTINLKLKENKKTGYFGKISVSGGLLKDIDDRYNNNLMFSTFKGKRKLSAFLLNGNTGQDGLSWQDNEKFGGESDNYSMSMDEDGGMMFAWRGGGTDDEPDVNTENGFIRNINAGVQYSNKWNDKHSFNFSPKYNNQVYDNTKTIFTQTQILDTLTNNLVELNENANQISAVNRYNTKLRATYDIKIDSMNSLKITANANFYHTESNEAKNAITTGNTGDLKNTSSRNTESVNDKTALSANIIFKHKFRKARRTLSFTADWKSLATEGNSYLKSVNQSYINGLPITGQNLNQLKDNNKQTQNLSSKLVYTEPLSKKYSLELGYEFTYISGNNNQVTYSYSPVSGKYDAQVDSLTNDFDQLITIHKPSVKLNYSNKKIKVNIGSGFGLTHFDMLDNTINQDYIRNFTNFFPSASANYTYKPNHNFRFNYNGSTKQPSINQLQPLTNNTDYYNQYIGNPDLKPSFTNNFNISHNSYNFIKDRWMYQSINFNQSSNAITNNRIINTDSAKTITQPINTNGNYSFNIWAGGGFKIKKIDTRFNLNPNINYSRFADVINNKTSYSKNMSAGLGINISKSKDKKYDISLNNDFNYNTNKTSQANATIKYYTNTLTADVTIYIHKVWSINTDYQFYARQKTAQFSNNLNNQTWNARLQKTFRNNEFTAFIKVRDILNQNIGIERNFYSNTLSEERNDRLKRYWLVGFTWDFKNKAPKGK